MSFFDMSHADSVIRESAVCPSLMSRMGSGGNQVPLVLFNTALTYGTVTQDKVCKTLTAQMANQTDAPLVLMDQGGHFMNVEFGKTGALPAQMHGHAPVVFHEAYRISSEKSWAMMSDNPNAGIRRAEISPTLDTTTPTPAKAQGGLMIVSVSENQRAEVRLGDALSAITQQGGKPGQGNPVVFIQE